MIIAVDFDGVICKQVEWRKGPAPIGEPIEGAKEYINKLYDEGHIIIIWTVRHDRFKSGGLVPAVKYLMDNGIKFHYINRNGNEIDFETSNKIYYDVLIDDRAIGGMLPWSLIYKLVISRNKHYMFDYMKIVNK